MEINGVLLAVGLVFSCIGCLLIGYGIGMRRTKKSVIKALHEIRRNS